MTLVQRMPKVVVVAVAFCLLMGLSWSFSRANNADPAGKLVIVKAVYGDLPDGNKIDVTEKVAAMVKDDALSVQATNDNFTDPADGIVKKLKVDYKFDGVEKSKTVTENDTLTISATGE